MHVWTDSTVTHTATAADSVPYSHAIAKVPNQPRTSRCHQDNEVEQHTGCFRNALLDASTLNDCPGMEAQLAVRTKPPKTSLQFIFSVVNKTCRIGINFEIMDSYSKLLPHNYTALQPPAQCTTHPNATRAAQQFKDKIRIATLMTAVANPTAGGLPAEHRRARPLVRSQTVAGVLPGLVFWHPLLATLMAHDRIILQQHVLAWQRDTPLLHICT
jgi:hypothetical protein